VKGYEQWVEALGEKERAGKQDRNQSRSVSDIGVNSGGLGCRDPRFWAGESWGVAWGSWTGRETLLYIIIYRKYVRKWRLFNRNRI